jgi:hypothetical protein
MTRLDLLDPTRPDDTAFDPHGSQAERVRAAALARHAPDPARHRTPRRRIALGLATVVAATAAVVTSTTAPTDARAALLRAAERTGAIESGRVVWTLQADHPGPGYAAEVRNEVRFSGDDAEITSRGTETLPGGKVTERRTTFRLIDGVGYTRDDTRPGRPFERLEPISRGGEPLAIVDQAGNEALVALVKSTRDLQVDGDTYRGTTTAGAIEDAAPTAPSRSKSPAWDQRVELELTVGDDGLIRRVIARGEHDTRTTEYLDLGEPQTIEAP